MVNEAHAIVGEHVRATPDGRVKLRVRGSGPATVTLRSARPVASRWLTGGRPRPVVLGTRRLVLRPGSATDVTIHLSPEHLALLHRMRTMRVALRLETGDAVQTRRISLHSPAPRGRHGRRPSCLRRDLRGAGRQP